MQLNNTHLVLLSAAAQRDDKLLLPPGRLGHKAAGKLAARLVAAGLVEATAVTANQPQWGTSPEGEPTGLRITTAGLEAIGIERDTSRAPATPPVGEYGRDGADASSAAEQADGAVEEQSICSPEEAAADEGGNGPASDREPSSDEVAREEVSSDAVASGAVVALPRAGSKRALLIALLRREEGASVGAIMAATGWLPHSTRAALTGLRKAGHQLVKSKDAAGKTTYRVIDPAPATGRPADIAAE